MTQDHLNSQSQNHQAGSFDVLVLAAAAGGHAPVTTFLHGLPEDFSVPVILMMHLGPESTAMVDKPMDRLLECVARGFGERTTPGVPGRRLPR